MYFIMLEGIFFADLKSDYLAELFPQHLAWRQADSFDSNSIAERRSAKISASLKPMDESNPA
jgi:hypothetical protein